MAIVQIVDQMSMDELLKGGKSFSLPSIGEMVTGTVVSIGKNTVIVDIDNAAIGMIKGHEAQDSNNTIKKLKVGDPITATVLDFEDESGYILLSLRYASQGMTWNRFVDSFENGTKIDVTIVEANKGGLLIEEDGIRGFIPVSQLSPKYYPRVPGGNSARILEKLKRLMGVKLTVKVINMDESEGRLILSEKEAQREEREKVLQTLEVGKIIHGTISGVVDFGIFVNYNGVEGLVHISEIDWGHVSNPNDYGKVGDEADVVVIGIDGEKISFSIKRLTPDPWIVASKKYSLGDKVTGTVNKITDYGVFVKLEESISGLIHISELSEGKDVEVRPSSLVSVGQEVECYIINLDHKEHEIGLTLNAESVKLKQIKDGGKDTPAEVKKASK